MATWTPTVISDNTDGSWTREDNSSAVDIYAVVDEGIAAADGVGAKIALNTSNQALFLNLSSPPGDLTNGSVTAVTIQQRHKQSGRSDDTIATTAPVGIWDTAIATVLAGNAGLTDFDTGYTITSPNNTSYTNDSAYSFAGVRTAATAAQWTGAVLGIYSPIKTVSMGADSVTWFVDCFDITITYTASSPKAPAPRSEYLKPLRASLHNR